MGNDSELSIVIRARNEAKTAIEEVKSQVQGMGKHIGDSLEAARAGSMVVAGAVVAAGAAAVGFGALSVKAYMESQNAASQLAAVIKSTGSAAGVSSKDMLDFATSLQKTTTFSDEAVTGVESMLLTFTEIKGPKVKEATRTVLDMAQALGEDAKSASIQLGKALNDPITGVTALKRVGVTFNATQMETIKRLQEGGDMAGAQAVVLKELQKEFGGSAEAAGKTFAGQLTILKNTFGDLQEAVGKTILDALQPLMTAFQGVVNDIGAAGGVIPYVSKLFRDHKDTLVIVAGAIVGALIPALVLGAAALWGMIEPLLPFIAIGIIAAVGIQKLVEHFGGWKKVMDDIKPILNDVKTAITIIWTALTGGDATMTGAGRQWDHFGNIMMSVHDTIMSVGKTIIGYLVGAFKMIVAVIQFMLPSLQALWNSLMTNLVPALIHLWTVVAPVLIPVLKFLAEVIGVIIVGGIWLFINVLNIVIQVISWFINILASVLNIAGAVVMGIIGFFQLMWAILSAVFNAVWQIATTIFNAIAAVVSTVFGVIIGIINVFLTIYTFIFQTIFAIAMWIWNAIYSVAIAPVVNAIVAAAQWLGGIIAGVWNWIAAVAGGVWGAVSSFARSAWNTVAGIWNGAVGWFSGIFNGIRNVASGIIGGLGGVFSGAWNGLTSGFRSAANTVIDLANKLISGYNNTVGKIPGTPHIGNIPHFASGVQGFAGGMAVVGERGPELMYVPPGASVYSNEQSKQMTGRSVTIGTVVLQDASAVQAFFRELDNDTILSGKGLTPMRGGAL